MPLSPPPPPPPGWHGSAHSILPTPTQKSFMKLCPALLICKVATQKSERGNYCTHVAKTSYSKKTRLVYSFIHLMSNNLVFLSTESVFLNSFSVSGMHSIKGYMACTTCIHTPHHHDHIMVRGTGYKINYIVGEWRKRYIP